MKNALIAESDHALQLVLAVVLRKQGLQIESTSSGRELMELARQRPYLIMVIDWNLKQVNGTSAIQEIRLHARNASFKASYIVATYTDNEVKDEMMVAGANEFLEKPYELETIKQAFHRACSGSE